MGITIDASGNDMTPSVADGQGTRILEITDPTSGATPPAVTLIGLTLTGGDTASTGGAVYDQGSELHLRDCTITGNNSNFNGGALYARGLYSNQQVEIESCTLAHNTANGAGGAVAVFLDNHSSLIVEDSTISENTSGDTGGGIYAKARAASSPFPTQRAITISHSKISGNTSTFRGGGIYAQLFFYGNTDRGCVDH